MWQDRQDQILSQIDDFQFGNNISGTIFKITGDPPGCEVFRKKERGGPEGNKGFGQTWVLERVRSCGKIVRIRFWAKLAIPNGKATLPEQVSRFRMIHRGAEFSARRRGETRRGATVRANLCVGGGADLWQDRLHTVLTRFGDPQRGNTISGTIYLVVAKRRNREPPLEGASVCAALRQPMLPRRVESFCCCFHRRGGCVFGEADECCTRMFCFVGFSRGWCKHVSDIVGVSVSLAHTAVKMCLRGVQVFHCV